MQHNQPIPIEPGKVLPLLPPFPVVLVTVRTNVLTVNQLHYFTFAPLRLGVAIARSRHSFELLRQQREFVVNVPTKELIDAVKRCGATSGRDHDKFAAAGLDPEPSIQVAAPSIRQCGAHIECRVDREVEFEDRIWFIGQVVATRQQPGFTARDALMCGRTDYCLQGNTIAAR